EESIRYTFASFISGEGHDVVTAGSYAEGIASIAASDFDLIISDIVLGGKTGIDLLREVRARDLVCPVVMVTGYPTMETAAEALRLGAFDYIPKPVEQEAVLRVTRLALAYKQVLDENIRYRGHLEAIFSSVEDGILTMDEGLRVLEMNDSAARICGISREAVGRELGASLRHCAEKYLGALKETVERREPVKIARFECHHATDLRILTLFTYPLTDRHGLFTGAALVVRDETRLATLEQDLKGRSRFHNLIGRSGQMRKIYSLIESLADVDTTVLVTGESGTGKELVAEALHHMGVRNNRPLVKVNCSVLSESLLESELFGHVKGAFTGAVSDRVGRFQKADGGTIFLDEIGDISPRVQSSLLRVLQEKEFERVGDSRPLRVDVRVIAATNKNLLERVRQGLFREDLYYRLKVVELPLPPLRERREDISLLVEHFLKQFNVKFHKDIQSLSADVELLFLNYHWPGNVRELKHALEHAWIVCGRDTITVDDLPGQFKAPEETGAVIAAASEGLDPQMILQALEKTAWNKAKAARLLGVDRKTLYRNMEKFNIKEMPE
ncbi:MAG: sigma 54-interacting transcriptional regulator, partial [Geobacteraceae bacterium]|nr:sigma 54-interacting transcriptional regulator [Geobacteraceae bacterium]